MIRRATEADIDALNELLFEVHAVHAEGRPDIFKPGAKKFTTEELVKIISDDSEPVFVYDEGGRVLGHAFCEIRSLRETGNTYARRFLFIHDLCVLGSARGRGIGTALYRYVCEYAKCCGCNSVELNVWAFNEGAVAFYKSLGLKPLSMIMEEKMG